MTSAHLTGVLKTLAELLEALREKEEEALAGFGGVGHQGMIGDMYEGLTREILSRSLFEGVDLRVVTGKVRMGDGSFSKQIDAMIVKGDGERMPYSEHYLYPPEDVIAAVEVKKTLYGEELDDAYKNLRSFYHKDYLERVPFGRLQFVFRKVGQSELPDDGDMSRLSWEKEMLAHVLMWDVAMPIRIVFGYDGYVNEYTLREGFVDYLERVLPPGGISGYGPPGLPNLIVCGNSSLVKLNGMPYAAPVEGAREWLLYASSSARPVALLLEVIWTRLLSMRLIDQEVFGEDMDVEQLHPLLYARPIEKDGHVGWQYRSQAMSKAQLSSTPHSVPWEPIQLNDKEAVLVSHLCKVTELNTRNNEFWMDWVADVNHEVEHTLTKLRLGGIAALDDDGFLRLLTEDCQVAVVPDIGWVAAENSGGRLTRWILAYMTTRKTAKELAE